MRAFSENSCILFDMCVTRTLVVHHIRDAVSRCQLQWSFMTGAHLSLLVLCLLYLLKLVIPLFTVLSRVDVHSPVLLHVLLKI